MEYNYTYEIASVDESAKVMEVVYSLDGKPSITVGVRLPFEGEDVGTLIDIFSPVLVWREEDAPRVPPSVGLKGLRSDIVVEETTVVVSATTVDDAKVAKINEIKEWRKSVLAESFNVDGSSLVSPDNKTLNTLRSIKSNIADGIYQSVDFRLEDGSYIAIDDANVDMFISSVSLRMQSVFDEEKLKIEYVNGLTDVATIEAYNPALIPSISL